MLHALNFLFENKLYTCILYIGFYPNSNLFKMKLADALSSRQGDVVTFSSTVIKQSTVQLYENAGQKREYILVTVADVVLRVSMRRRSVTWTDNKSYTFRGVIRKTGEAQFWFVFSSMTFQSATLVIPDDVRQKALQDEIHNEPNKNRTLSEALVSTTTSCVPGVVVNRYCFITCKI